MPRKKQNPVTEQRDELSAQEQTAIKNNDLRRDAQTAPRLKVLKNGNEEVIAPDHPDISVGFKLLMEALGTADGDFAKGLMRQLADASSQKNGQCDEHTLNYFFSVIKDAKPKDHLEAMLVAQMAVVHALTMAFAQRFPGVETQLEHDTIERGFTKLTRTFTTQIEALKRYRTGHELQVTVQNVSVSEGGQAIVGNVTRAAPDTAVGSPPVVADARMAPMQTVDITDGAPVELQHDKDDE
jgi:hypothetical protein